MAAMVSVHNNLSETLHKPAWPTTNETSSFTAIQRSQHESTVQNVEQRDNDDALHWKQQSPELKDFKMYYFLSSLLYFPPIVSWLQF